jgi:hypothetical protein
VDVPLACSLEAPAARAQLDEWGVLLAETVTAMERPAPTSVHMTLRTDDPSSLGELLALARRETLCCPFFRFRLEVTAEATTFTAEVPAEAASLLDGLARLVAGASRD